MGSIRLAWRLAVGACLSLASIAPSAARDRTNAYTLTTLYSFCAQQDCVDGSSPSAGLASDQAGNFYGVAESGGAHGYGTVYKLSKKPNGRLRYRLLYTFCSLADCADGQSPKGRLVIDTAGNLYGAAQYSGGPKGGVVFKLRKNGVYEILHSFCSKLHCPDGNEPFSGLTYFGAGTGALYDGVSPLYGTTVAGGAYKRGTVFKLQRKPNGSWKETVIYSFCASAGCPDGSGPTGALTVDGAGNLYGVTGSGGDHTYSFDGGGVIYKLTPEGSESVLYDFCSQSACADGQFPFGSVALDGDGNLFGTAADGGANGQGVVYKFGPNAQYAVLHDFCSEDQCADGSFPLSGPTIGADGKVYGTAMRQGDSFTGVVYRTDGSQYEVLHAFCSQGCGEGNSPSSELIFDQAGALFGTTRSGGANGHGTVFELLP